MTRLHGDDASVGTDRFWNDVHGGSEQAAVYQRSADCNNDGVVGYGQIRADELADLNSNNIPGCCEQSISCIPCDADVDESGAVNGVDLAGVLNNWGVRAANNRAVISMARIAFSVGLGQSSLRKHFKPQSQCASIMMFKTACNIKNSAITNWAA